MGTVLPQCVVSASTASGMSARLNTSSDRTTRTTSSTRSEGTCSDTLNTSDSPMDSMTSPADDVPMTSSFLPGGGMRLIITSSVCSTTLEKRGPMATYSSRRSMSSRMMTDSGERYASSNTRVIWLLLVCSAYPTRLSGEMTLTKGNSDSMATVAAMALLPDPTGPSSTHVSSGVLSLFWTWRTSVRSVCMMWSNASPHEMMPCTRYSSSVSVAVPNAGFTSSSARSKSAMVTLMLSSSSGLCRSLKSTCLLSAYAVASLTRPSISAPLKFLVTSARCCRSTSREMNEFSLILDVWILRIWKRPASSGSPISICTSRRPGRSSASSSMSRLLVMPMSRMLLSASTPSILVSSWFTTVSCTPDPSRTLPRCLHTASISSKMMMCRSDESPLALYSSSASANRLRMFSSD
mmetsp:Transcript_23273/g.59477  ORF Transcript_23273/g.59477 Transcript_23273/m.59477 type:complete len:408 (-) Transcript_23273:1022-2245(-)